MNSLTWRQGSRVPLNIYEGDRPVCQCHTPEDAALIVAAVNEMAAPPVGESAESYEASEAILRDRASGGGM